MSQSSRLQLSLSGKNLKNLAGFFEKSDPFCVVTVRGEDKNNPPIIVGETEVIFNNLNPDWATVVIVDSYRFGVPFYVEVGVFDFNAKHVGVKESKLAKQSSVEGAKLTSSDETRELLRTGQLPHTVMGTALFELGEVMGARGNIASKSLQTGGAIYVHLERSRPTGDTSLLNFQLRGLRLPNNHVIGKINPFFELYRKVDRPTGASWNSVFHSNVLRGVMSPRWNEEVLDLEKVCNGDLDRPMKIIVWDHRKSGRHKHIGEVETTMKHLIEGETTIANEEYAFPLRSKTDKKAGYVLVLKAAMEVSQQASHPHPGGHEVVSHPSPGIVDSHRPEFVDYLSGGCQISLAVAIDFTASNGDPRQEGSPHYFHSASANEWNDYEKAIFAVGSILAKYDTDQKFPVWGFGAKYNNVVRHCFQCGTDVEVEGVQGIMDAYRGVFSTPLTMSYPTLFTEVIATAAAYASHEQEEAQQFSQLSYTILLILTAGNVENVEETKRLLLEASDTPLSIVIVGIGDSAFQDMEFLDEHDPQTEGGRDITKFVKFSDYTSYNALTEAVLDEIPDQVVDYYYGQGIMPGEAETLDIETVHVQEPDDDERTFTFLG